MSSFKDELRNRLREDTETASPGFTRSVLARIEERPERAWFVLRPRLAMAAAVVLIALGAALGTQFGEQVPTASARRAQLLREYQEIQSELEQIQRLADDSGPVLYLGGDETVDVLFDLSSYVDSKNIRPASLSTDG